jgi:hypothetical protein
MKSFAIVVKYSKEKDYYGVSHLKDATHLMFYKDGMKAPVVYSMDKLELKKREKGERGPIMIDYLKALLRKYGLEQIELLVTVTNIQVKGPWRKNVPYDEDSDARKIAEKYTTEKEKLKDMERKLYT